MSDKLKRWEPINQQAREGIINEELIVYSLEEMYYKIYHKYLDLLDPEDVLQELRLHTLTLLPKYDKNNAALLTTWLYRCLTNHAINLGKKWMRTVGREYLWPRDEDGVEIEIESPDRDVLEIMVCNDKFTLHKAISKLDPELRIFASLYLECDGNRAAVARRLPDINQRTVYRRCDKMFKNLKEIMADEVI